MRGYSQQQTASEQPNAIEELKSRMKWIDIKQLLEKHRYKSLKKTRTLLHILLFSCISLVVCAFYYVLTPHAIYSESGCEQLNYVSGLEYLLLKFQLINPNIADCGYELDFLLYVYAMCIGLFVLLRVTSLFDTSIINEIYNIQDGESRYRAVENSKGEMGICKAGKLKMKMVLPFKYDEIFATYDNSYVCKKDGKYGVYNTDLKKMVLPVEYDDIHSISPESIVLIKDNNQHCFSNKGYRIVNK